MWLRILSTILSILFVLEMLPISVMAEEYNEYKDLSNAELSTQQEEKSPIVSEVVSERDAFKKVFEREDGSFTAIISSGPVHYYEDGEWLEIDNTLTETNGTITNESNGFSVDLPSEITSDKNVTIATENAELSFTMENISSSAAEITEVEPVDDETSLMMGFDNIASSVEYTSVMTNTDLVYDIGADSVKESIILSSCPAQATDYSYSINSNGATLHLNEDNSINVVKNGQIEFVIEAPYMFDSNGFSTDNIDVSLEKSENSEYNLTYSPDYDWLSSQDRAYPVTIDPTTTVYSATVISEAFIGTVNETATDLDKFHYFKNGNRLYFKYSDAIAESFGKNSVITNAEFSLCCEALTDDDTLAVFPISSEWTEETVTPVTETVELLDYNVIKYGEEAQRYVWDITEVASKWQMNQFDNNGICLRQLSDSSINTKIYRSTTANLTSRRPWFQIDYVTIDNMAEYDTETVDMGRAGTLYLNKYTGTYYVKRTDLSLNGNVSPVEMSFTYDPWSESVNVNSTYGSYWTTDYYNKIFYSQTVTENGITRHQYTFRDNGGIKTRFVEVVSTDEDYSTVPEGFTESYLTDYTRYKAVSGDLSKCLWVPKSDTTYKDFANMIVEDSTYRYTIDSINRVTSRVHKTSGAVIAIEHRTTASDAIRSVTDGVGRKYDLATVADTNGKTVVDKLALYNASGEEIKVSTLTGDVAIGVDYSYTAIDDSTSHLTTVTYADGESIAYEYNADGFMTAITNVDGSRLELRYSGDRVIGYTKYAYYVSAGNSQNCFESQLDINFDGPKQRTFTYYEYDKTTPSIVTKQRYDSNIQSTDFINSDGEYSYTKTINTDTAAITSYSTNDDEAINLITNGDFSNGKTGWISVPDNASIGLPVLSETFAFDGISGKVIALNSGLRKNLRVGQTIASLPANDDTVYTLSAWAKTLRSAATSYVNDHAHLDKTFAICVTDSEGNVLAQYDFDTTTDEWQFGAVSFKTDVALEDIKVILLADSQVAYTRFDDVRLVESSASSVEVLSDEEETFDTQSVLDSQIVADDGITYKKEPCGHCSCVQCVTPITVICNNEEQKAYFDCDCNTEHIIGSCSCYGCRQDRSESTVKDIYGNIVSNSFSDGTKTLSKIESTYALNGSYLASSTDSSGNSVFYNYNLDTGFLDSCSKGINSLSNMEYVYNAYGALEQVSIAVNGLSSGEAITTNYSYLNNKISTISHRGTIYSFEYDGYGNVVNIRVAGSDSLSEQLLVSYGYNNRQLQNRITYGNGLSILYLMNDKGAISEIRYNTGQRYTYEYDEETNTTTAFDYSSGIVTVNKNGEITSVKLFTIINNTPVLGEEIYCKTHNGDYTETETVLGTLFSKSDERQSYISNMDSVQTSYSINSNNTTIGVSVTEDFFGRTITKDYNVLDYSYNYSTEYLYEDTTTTVADRVVGLRNNINGVVDSEYSYTFDSRGNILSINKSNSPYKEYIYDEAEQLIAEYDYLDGTSRRYMYDNNGNIVSKFYYTNVTSEDLTNASLEETVWYAYSDVNWSDKLTSYDGQDIIYDVIGNPTTYRGANLTWDGKRMSSYSINNKRYEYEYNVDGMRTVKRTYIDNILTESCLYIWKETTLIACRVSSLTTGVVTNVCFLYDNKDELFGAYVNGEMYAFIKNLQGDIISIVSLNSGATLNIEYDAWGNPVYKQSSGDSVNLYILSSIGYRGYLYDRETGLYYLESRYYDPETGRFISADDIEMIIPKTPNIITAFDKYYNMNVYSYCRNNPVMDVDNDGMASKTNNNNLTFLTAFFVLVYMLKDYTVITNGSITNHHIANKGQICVNFLTTKKNSEGKYIRSNKEDENFYYYIDICYKTYKDEFFEWMADVVMGLFKEQYKYPHKYSTGRIEMKKANRAFLFTKKCVANEIKLHFLGYMWSINKKGYSLPAIFTPYYVEEGKSGIRSACQTADMLEMGPGYEKKEALGFNYFGNINAAHKKTIRDPYYNTKYKIRTPFVRDDWFYHAF